MTSKRIAGLALITLTTVCWTAAKSAAALPQSQGEAQANSAIGQQTAVSLQSLLSDETAAEIKRVTMTFKQAALSDSAEIRASAVQAMLPFLAYDETLFDIVMERAREDEPAVKIAAMYVLIQQTVPSPPPGVLDTLLAMLSDEDIAGADRELLVDEILNGWPAEIVVPRMADLLQQSDREAEQLEVIALLTRYGAEARDAVLPLMEQASDEAAPVAVRTASMRSVATIMGQFTTNEVRERYDLRQAIALVDATMTMYDATQDGAITQAELGRSPVVQIGSNDNKNHFNMEFRDVDRDSDGIATREELTTVALSAMKSQRSSRERQRAAADERARTNRVNAQNQANAGDSRYSQFARAFITQKDLNRNGTLERNEWGQSGIVQPEKADANGDGVLTVLEVIDFISTRGGG